MSASVFDRRVYCLLGLPFDAVDAGGALRRVRVAVARREPCFLSTPNVNWVVACRSDAPFRESVLASHLVVADGMPLVWVARLLGIPIRERVAGSGLFEALRRDRAAPLAVYFFGGQEGVAQAACKQLAVEAGGLKCAGFHFPGLGTVEEMSTPEVVATINASGADFVVVSLGARKGQAWIERNRRRLTPPVIGHLGAVVDFVGGARGRAPERVQRLGLEWLWRIKEQPDLWRRYAVDGLALLRLLVSRVIPGLWWARRHRPVPADIDAARIELGDESGGICLRLHGAWVERNVDRLREAFVQAARGAKDVTLAMEGVTCVDAAFLGLVLLLRGCKAGQGRRLVLASVREPVRRTITFCCAEFLLEGAPD